MPHTEKFQGRTLLQFLGGLKSPHISGWGGGAKLSRLIFEKSNIRIKEDFSGFSQCKEAKLATEYKKVI